MASSSEKSFGARLRNTQDIVQYIKVWRNYAPPRTTETIEGMETFINEVIEANRLQTAAQQDYNTATVTRQKHFTKEITSIDKMLSPIRGSVEANFGKTSVQAKQVSAIIKQMRKTKAVKLQPNPSNPDEERTMSQSHRSYGSLTKYFADIVVNIANMPGYISSNPALTVEGLKQKLADVNAINIQVASTLQKVKAARHSRTNYYNEMAERVRRIKAYVKSQYGIQSTEYKSISGIII